MHHATQVRVDVAIEAKDFASIRSLVAKNPGQKHPSDSCVGTLEALQVRGMPDHQVGAIQTMDVEVILGEALRSNFTADEIHEFILALPVDEFPSEIVDQIQVHPHHIVALWANLTIGRKL
jgi:hypothetical protein